MFQRRRFIQSVGGIISAGFCNAGLNRVFQAVKAHNRQGISPSLSAYDEDFWFEIQQAFTVDRSLVNLDNGGVCPSPAVVQKAMNQYLDYSNQAPTYTMWKILEPQLEGVRHELSTAFGCSSEEMALTRNASEGLQILQLGHDLQVGDEVLTTDQDYPRLITTWKQRVRREGIVLRQFRIPVPAEDPARIVELLENNLTERTRIILLCHMINLTGQILPVKEVVKMSHRYGIPVIVDGAHAFAQLNFKHNDLNCDYYVSSLHKWLFAPHGTGLLYVRKKKIREVWPMMAAPVDMSRNIRKFEEIGTHPVANYLAISEALSFHNLIGIARKEARLRYLTHYWAKRLLENPRVTLNTSLKPEFSCALANFRVDGISSKLLVEHLWSKHRILVNRVKHPDCRGIRVAPAVYTTVQELDFFCEAVEKAIKTV